MSYSCLDHGIHNEAACDSLFNSAGPSFTDWVATIAFYAALHYVNHEIFPLNSGGIVYADFDSYYSALNRKRRKSKHIETLKLVGRHIPQARAAYKSLLDTSMNARYHDYQLPDWQPQMARDDLKVVKSFLMKLATTPAIPA